MFNKSNTIAIGSDHGGFAMKTYIIENLSKEGYKFKDYGTYSADSVDYPIFAHKVAEAVADGSMPIGMLICGSGNGISMAANKHKGIRCALCWLEEIAELAKKHNNANILSMPGRFIPFELSLKITKVFLDTEFEGGRHEKRVEKIDI